MATDELGGHPKPVGHSASLQGVAASPPRIVLSLCPLELVAELIDAALERGPLFRREFASPGLPILFGIRHGGAFLGGRRHATQGVSTARDHSGEVRGCQQKGGKSVAAPGMAN